MSNLSSGIITRKSVHSVDATVELLEETLKDRGIKLFAIIDHMPNTKLIIFGYPKAGTPIMVAPPGAALDLPLKILVSEDSAGDVWLSYNSTSYLQARHGFPRALVENIAGVESLASIAAE